jgi:hypothetical protein
VLLKAEVKSVIMLNVEATPPVKGSYRCKLVLYYLYLSLYNSELGALNKQGEGNSYGRR